MAGALLTWASRQATGLLLLAALCSCAGAALAPPRPAQNPALMPAPQRLEDGFPQVAVDNFNRRHARYCAEAAQGGIDLLFLGDSIVQGFEGPGHQLWLARFAGRRAAAFGVGYDRTQQLLWRLQHGEGDGLSPRAVVLLIGTNNVGAQPTEEVAAGVLAVLAEVQRRMPRARVLLLGVFPRGPPESDDRAQIAALNLLLARADDGDRVRFLDVGKVFLGAGGAIDVSVMYDLLHPTALGYQLWADAMATQLDALLPAQ